MIPGCNINHFGYLVHDLASAADHWSRAFGAGPFFVLRDIEFETISFEGKDATFDHSAALGWCGSTIVELVQLKDSSPQALTERLVPGSRPILNHVGYITDNPENESARLSAMGLEMFLRVTAAGVDARFHDARHLVGCAVEIQRRSDYVEAFFAHVIETGLAWDGRDNFRPANLPRP